MERAGNGHYYLDDVADHFVFSTNSYTRCGGFDLSAEIQRARCLVTHQHDSASPAWLPANAIRNTLGRINKIEFP
jgi:hypothetical protein